MPTYDYACSDCGHRFEKFESIGDDGLKECPRCGKAGARRLLGTGAGVIFKGRGFYATEYGRSRSETPGKGKTTRRVRKEEPKR